MRVIFNHGKESGPWGTKINALADVAEAAGCSVESIDYQDIPDDADKRVERLLARMGELDDEPVLLVGSSMGGYVATVAASQKDCVGVFVLAPAYFMGGTADFDQLTVSAPVHIVHGWQDDVVPVENSWRFAKRLALPLTVIDDDHRLVNQLEQCKTLFHQFLDQCVKEVHRDF